MQKQNNSHISKKKTKTKTDKPYTRNKAMMKKRCQQVIKKR